MFTHKLTPIIAGALILSGCAEMEVAPGQQHHLKNAPVNEASRAGIVSYSKEAFDEEAERQEAYDAMAKSCHGAYRILKEDVKKGDGDYINANGDFVVGIDDDRVYITFECVDA